ncbi:MAG: hypothetical protein ACRDMU_03280 [Gaiellaceae bacterium]
MSSSRSARASSPAGASPTAASRACRSLRLPRERFRPPAGLRSIRTLALIATLAAAAALAGCGGQDEAPADDAAPASGTPQVSGLGAGPAVAIDEALASGSDEPQLVAGNLLAQGGEVRLCSALAESFPPQCGGASLHVVGLKLAEVDGLITEGDVGWTDRPIELLGVVENDTQGKDDILTVVENAQQ